MNVVVLFSGGLDSLCEVAYQKHVGNNVFGLIFDYGQKRAEVEFAKRAAEELDFTLEIIQVTRAAGPIESYSRNGVGSQFSTIPNFTVLYPTFAACYAELVGASNVVAAMEYQVLDRSMSVNGKQIDVAYTEIIFDRNKIGKVVDAVEKYGLPKHLVEESVCCAQPIPCGTCIKCTDKEAILVRLQ